MSAKCKLTDLTKIGDFIKCELSQYLPDATAFTAKVAQQAQQLGNSLLDRAQKYAQSDLTKLEQLLQTVEKSVHGFIAEAMADEKQVLDDVEARAQKFLKSALAEMDQFMKSEVDQLLHRLAPILAWVVLMLFTLDRIKSTRTMSTSAVTIMSFAFVLAADPKWRQKIDVFAIPLLVAALAYTAFSGRAFLTQ